MAFLRSGHDHDTEDAIDRSQADGEPPEAASPFPRYERISEELAEGGKGHPDPREGERPRTESYGELWSRARRRTLGR